MRLIASLLLLLVLTDCRTKRSIEPVSGLPACQDPQYTRAKQLLDINTVIIAKTYTTATGDRFTKYYLDQPDVPGFTVPWAPCNLPQPYQKNGLAVRISGYVLVFSGTEAANTAGNPIELSQIVERTKL